MLIVSPRLFFAALPLFLAGLLDAAGISASAQAQQMGEFPLYKEAVLPLPHTRAALRQSLAELQALTAADVERLSQQALPAIILETSPVEDQDIATGDSKLGGAPDLPAGMDWPMRPAYPDAGERHAHYRALIGPSLAKAGLAPDWLSPDDGKRYVEEQRRRDQEVVDKTLAELPKDQADELRPLFAAQSNLTPEEARATVKDDILQSNMLDVPFPLSFIGQVNLAALSSEEGFDPDLPKTGRLLLFYDRLEIPAGWQPGSRVGFRLIWDDTPVANLQRATIPAALADVDFRDSLVLTPARITPHSVVTPIFPSMEEWDNPTLTAAASQTFGEGPYWSYAAFLSRFGTPADNGRSNHQLGGFPQPLQNGMQAQAQLASRGLDAGSSDAYKTPEAQAALKGAADWKLVLQIGVDEPAGLSVGACYALMRRDDLLARRFDQAWVVCQFG